MNLLNVIRQRVLGISLLVLAQNVHAQHIGPASQSRHELAADVVVDVYLPQRQMAGPPIPVALLIPGGGWSSSDRSAMYPLGQQLLARGMAVVVTSYRHAPAHPWPAQLEDVARVISWIRTHAQTVHIHPDKVVAIGASAGGMLAAHLGSLQPSSASNLRANRVIAVSAPWDLVDAAQSFANHHWQAHPAYPDIQALGIMSNLLGWPLEPARLYQASPYWHINSKTAPTLVIHGDADTLVPPHQSRIVCERMKTYQVPCTLVIIPNVGHTMNESFLPPMLRFLRDWLPGY